MEIKDIQLKLAQEFANIRKQIIGKGPEDIQVFIHGNTIFVKLRGLWTPLEQYLLSFIQKNNLLSQLHSSLLDQAHPMVEEILNSHIDMEVKVTNIAVDIYLESNEAHAVILLDQNLEKEIKRSADKLE
jgi:uncharacterized protein YbcI